MKIPFFILCFVSLLICHLTGHGKEPLPSLSNIINFSTQEYHAGNKNWSIAQDAKGIIYVANNSGLLEYNGMRWRLYTDAPYSLVRSVAVDPQGLIYTGGFEGFGYWKRNNKGQLYYTSLENQIQGGGMRPNEEIWKILITKKGIYFQSFARMFFYDYKSIRVIDPEQFILYLHEINDRLLIEGSSVLMEVKGFGITRITSTPEPDMRIILPHSPKEVLLGSARGGLFLYDGEQIKPWNAEISTIMRKEELNCGMILRNGNYLLGTLSNGLYEVSPKGKLIWHHNTDTFLNNNTILSLFEDNNGNIWVGYDNGIAKLEYSERYTYLLDPDQHLGSVYTSALYGDRLYIGTNRGLFYIPRSEMKNTAALGKARLISGSQGQVWKIKVIDDQLFVGHNHGLLTVKGDRAEFVTPSGGVMDMYKFNRNGESYILFTTYVGPGLLKKSSDGKYTFDTFLSGLDQPCSGISIDHLGNIWLEHMLRGLFLCTLDQDMRQLTLKHHFTAKDVDNQTDSRFRISEFQGRVVILCSNKFFLYNDLDNKLVPFEMLNKSGTSHSAISKLIELDHNTCWIVETDAVSLYDFSKSEGKLVTQCHYAKNISSIDSYENVVRANDSTSLICLVNGVILYKHTIDLNAKQEKPVLSLSLALAKGRDNSVDTLDIMSNQPISIPYNRNHVVLEFSCPSTVNRPSYFQYKLEGLSDQWSTPTRNYALDFERLPSGKYTFLLRIANSESDPVLRYSFRITPPWYRSIYALLVYLIALSAAIWISWRLLLHQEHKRYLMRMRSREEERIRKHNAILRQVVKNKNTELFNVTANAIQKNQVLNGIKAEMEKFVTSHPNTQIASKLDKISKSINYNKLAEEDWKLFVMHFEQTHEHFFKDVKDLHPTLTAGDLKLCACLKLNLSTKEIASLLSISIRGVEIGRYRLRKKINLASDINLNDYFIKNF